MANFGFRASLGRFRPISGDFVTKSAQPWRLRHVGLVCSPARIYAALSRLKLYLKQFQPAPSRRPKVHIQAREQSCSRPRWKFGPPADHYFRGHNAMRVALHAWKFGVFTSRCAHKTPLSLAKLNNIWPMSANVGRIWPKFGQHRPNIGRNRPNFGQLGRTLAEICQFWLNLGRLGRWGQGAATCCLSLGGCMQYLVGPVP